MLWQKKAYNCVSTYEPDFTTKTRSGDYSNHQNASQSEPSQQIQVYAVVYIHYYSQWVTYENQSWLCFKLTQFWHAIIKASEGNEGKGFSFGSGMKENDKKDT